MSILACENLEKAIPGFTKIVEKAQADAAKRNAEKEAKRIAEKKAAEEKALFGES